MNRKVAAIWLSLIMVISSVMIIVEFAPLVEATITLYVGGSGAGNYSTIQEGIDAANVGDTVFVYNGTYSEYVVVDKTLSLIGEHRNITIIDGGGWGDVVYITADWVNVTGFTISNGNKGIYLTSSSRNNISNNKILENSDGIYLLSSSYNTIIDNIISNSTYGINIRSSSIENFISSNNFSTIEYRGINLYNSPNNNITFNNFFENGIYISGIQQRYYDSHNIPTNNLINGKPIYYYKNSSGLDIDGISLGQLILANCTNIDVKNLFINNTYIGIHVAFSTFINITYITISDSHTGISVYSSSYNNISYNDIISCKGRGIELSWSSVNNDVIGNNITGNYVSLNNDGISLSNSPNNNLEGNSVSLHNRYGISVYGSSDTTITKNKISSNNNWGLFLNRCLNSNLSYNHFLNDGAYIIGDQLEHYNSHNIPPNNLVNNISLHYYKDLKNQKIDGFPIGQIILVNCSDFVIKNVYINYTDVGVEVAYSKNTLIQWNNFSVNTRSSIFFDKASNNTISNNNICNNYIGITFDLSSWNNIIKNNVSNNEDGGITFGRSSNNNLIACNRIFSNYWGNVYIGESSYNKIIGNNISFTNREGINFGFCSDNYVYSNNFIDNNIQAVENEYVNYWDNGYPWGGNYWSDYNGVDNKKGPSQVMPGSDGIGDTPYIFVWDFPPESKDVYPLMEPIGDSIYLFEGWNLISVPYTQTETNLTSVLSPIDVYYDAVQWYNETDSNDPWKHYKIGKPYGNDLFNLNDSMGFWIHISEPRGILFEFPGILPFQNRTINLHEGWNLVGFPSLTRKNRTTALNNLTFGFEIDAIWTYDSFYHKWEEIGPTDYFEPGKGYYIHSKIETTWEVPL